MKKNIITAAAFGMILLSTSCKKFDEGESNDEEVITTMKLNFTPVAGGATSSYKFEDLDGPGGNSPVIDAISLNANAVYNVSIELWNNSAIPPENNTTEVEEENIAHRFYYIPSVNNISISNLNLDDNGVSLGTTSTWTTLGNGSGTLNVILRHYPGTPPDKQASDPVTSPKSGTDIDVNFNYSVL